MANHTNDSRQTYEELEQRIHELTAQLKSHENREYKSRLFSFIFGRAENKHWTLSLYNAIHGTCYNELSSITINTIEDVVYMGMKNDVSILVSETVSLYRSMELYEQQSSYNLKRCSPSHCRSSLFFTMVKMIQRTRLSCAFLMHLRKKSARISETGTIKTKKN